MFYYYFHGLCYIFTFAVDEKMKKKSPPVIRKSATIYFTFDIIGLSQRIILEYREFIAHIIPPNINRIRWHRWRVSSNRILISSRKESVLGVLHAGNCWVFSPRRHNTDGCIARFRGGANCAHLERQVLLISRRNRELYAISVHVPIYAHTGIRTFILYLYFVFLSYYSYNYL